MSDEPVIDIEPTAIACRCCGVLQAVDHIEVTDAVKTEWLRYILGAKSFSQTYELYGGAVVFRFEKPSIEQVRAAEQAIPVGAVDLFEDSGAIEASSNALLVATLVEFARGQQEPYKIDQATAWEARWDKLSSVLGEQSIGDAKTLLRRFNLTVQALIERASDPDFWKAAGSAI